MRDEYEASGKAWKCLACKKKIRPYRDADGYWACDISYSSIDYAKREGICTACNSRRNDDALEAARASGKLLYDSSLERIYVGYDIGLDAYVESKAHRAELMKEKGVREAA